MMDTIKDLWKRRPDVFQLTGGTLLAATFAVVPLELGPVIATGLHLTGSWILLGYAIAVVFDLVWMGALSRVPAAARQKRRTALVTALSLALLGVGASVAGVILFGSMPVLAAVPVVALAMHGVGMLLDAELADADTDAFVRKQQLDDRNRKAKAAQGARSLAVTRELAARAKVASATASQADADAVEAALTGALARRDIRRKTQFAQLEADMARTDAAHKAAAEAFEARGLVQGLQDGPVPLGPGAWMPGVLPGPLSAIDETGLQDPERGPEGLESPEEAPERPSEGLTAPDGLSVPGMGPEALTEPLRASDWGPDAEDEPEPAHEPVGDGDGSEEALTGHPEDLDDAPVFESEGGQAPDLSPALAAGPVSVTKAGPDPADPTGWGFISGVLKEAERAVTEDPDVVLLTTAEVADRAGKSANTIRSWVARGHLAVHTKDPRRGNLFHPIAVADAVARYS